MTITGKTKYNPRLKYYLKNPIIITWVPYIYFIDSEITFFNQYSHIVLTYVGIPNYHKKRTWGLDYMDSYLPNKSSNDGAISFSIAHPDAGSAF